MFRSTAVLIEARSLHCNPKPTVVPVRRIPRGVPNECLDNAMMFADQFPDCMIVSGWLAYEYDSNGTADFIPHWWNRYNGEYVDITPLPPHLINEYVVDRALLTYAAAHETELATSMASPLTLTGRQFGIVTHLGGVFGTSTPTDDISCATLYRESKLEQLQA